MEIIIKPIILDLLDDFLYFFDDIGFADNPDWAGCYCYYHHCVSSDEEWIKRTGEKNRNASKELILSGKMNGYHAIINDKPIGWCHVDKKENFQKLPIEKELKNTQKDKIASIVCFLIASLHRKQGIARQLLRQAFSNFKNRGYDCIEAYPRKGVLSDAYNYLGPFSLYVSEEFYVYKELKDFYEMRKNL